jgi:hypothetical protein
MCHRACISKKRKEMQGPRRYSQSVNTKALPCQLAHSNTSGMCGRRSGGEQQLMCPQCRHLQMMPLLLVSTAQDHKLKCWSTSCAMHPMYKVNHVQSHTCMPTLCFPLRSNPQASNVMLYTNIFWQAAPGWRGGGIFPDCSRRLPTTSEL